MMSAPCSPGTCDCGTLPGKRDYTVGSSISMLNEHITQVIPRFDADVSEVEGNVTIVTEIKSKAWKTFPCWV